MSDWEGFYSTAQVSRLAGVPRSTLYQWKKQGIIIPSVRVMDNDQVVDEGYSYSDLAIIKLLKALRNRRLSLRSVVKSLRHLYSRFGPPNTSGWNNPHVYVQGKEVFAQRPDDWDTTTATKYGQRAEMKVLGELFEEDGSILIPKDFSDYIVIDVNVMEGSPVIRDTRVPTYMLAMLSEQGMTIEELAEHYSPIPKIALQKAIDFEKDLDKKLHEGIRPSTQTRTLAARR